jgi:nucleoside-diphosphate-sugar epimerase
MTGLVLVTGSTGFLGRPLCHALAGSGLNVRALYREPRQAPAASGIQAVPCRDIASIEQWRPILAGIDTVIHLAGRAHVMHERSTRGTSAYMRANLESTMLIARAAAAHGVRRFLFLSSIKVYGDGPFSQPLAATRIPAPDDEYGRSKWGAEQGLRALGAESPMEIAIVRPPLVYGPGVRANFLRLLRWVSSGLPLPFSAVHNKRSLLGLDNLIGFLVGLALRPDPSAGTWHVADIEACSTADLVRRLAAHMQRPAHLLACPPYLLRAGLNLLGRSRDYHRLCGSLVVDIQPTCDQLRWLPPHSLDDGLARTVAWFQGIRNGAGQ